MTVLRNELSKYGTVTTCNTLGTNSSFFIEIIDFEESAGNVGKCFNLIEKHIGKKFPKTENCKIKNSTLILNLIK